MAGFAIGTKRQGPGLAKPRSGCLAWPRGGSDLLADGLDFRDRLAGGGDVLWSVGSVPISDMALMYLLMGIFHASPWLKLVSVRARRFDNTIQTEGD